MNYLAHLYLSPPHPEAWVGNLMGDFVKGPVPATLPPAWRSGILLHRAVDGFTDRHPVVAAARARLPAPYRRYAGIVLDLFFDHLLARDWDAWADEPIEPFIEKVHCTLVHRYHRLPANMRSRMQYLVEHDLLLAYRHADAVRAALAGIGTRLRRPFPLEGALDAAERVRPALESDFRRFFPELAAFAKAMRRERFGQGSE